MSQPPIFQPQSMPSATILNYVARNVDDQPTRVRIIAAWCVLGFSLFPISVAGVLWYRLAPFFIHPSSIIWGFQEFLTNFVVALFVTASAIMMVICPHYIRRGRKWACLFSLFLVLPILVTCILSAGFFASYSLLEVVTPFKGPPQYIQLLWLGPALVFGLLTLIANDLRRYLQWIHKLPREEKPPIKFIG